MKHLVDPRIEILPETPLAIMGQHYKVEDPDSEETIRIPLRAS